MSSNNRKKNKGKGRATEPDPLNASDHSGVSHVDDSVECPDEPVPVEKVLLKLKLTTEKNPKDSSSSTSSNTQSSSSNRPKAIIRLPANLFKNVNKKRPRIIEPDEDDIEEDEAEEQSSSNKKKMTYREYQKQYRQNNAQYLKDYRKRHEDRYKEYQKEYRESNSEERSSYQRDYRKSRSEEYSNYQREYRESHSEEISNHQREYRVLHFQERSDYQRNYRQSNRSDNNHSVEPNEATWNDTRAAYENEIKKGPTIVCICCGGLFFLKNVVLISERKLREEWKCSEETLDATFWSIRHNIFDDHTNITFTKDDGSGRFYLCINCNVSIRKNKIPTIALSKGLHFPEEVGFIKELSRLEERLVAPRHFFQSIFTYKGITGQYKSKGGIVNVPVTVDTTVNSLPRNLDSTNTLHVSLARKLEFSKDYIKGVIDRDLVWKAADYLKNTELFINHDIGIADRNSWEEHNGFNNNTAESNAQEDTQMEDATINENSDDEDTSSLNVLATDSLIDNNTSIRLAPGEGRIPLSLVTDTDSDFLSFIKIFYGERLNGADKISYTALTKSLARRFDRRAVSRVDYLLYMDRKSQLLKMRSNVNTILRKRKNVLSDNQAPFTVRDVSNEDYITRLLNKDQAYKTFSGIRSSPEYWKNQKKNAMAMVRQLGVPSLFVTVSAAETKWNELLVILKKVVDNDLITEDQADELSYNEKARLIQSDPITTARYFDHRFRELKKTWNKVDGPFGEYEMIEYFFRIEFQHRGSPHVHMLIWLKDAPVLPDAPIGSTSEERELKRKICDFVDGIYTCSREWDGSSHHSSIGKSNEETWADLIKTRQTHKHTSTCRRKRGGNKIVCRFNIPFFPMIETAILTPLNVSDYTLEQLQTYKDMHERITEYLNDNYQNLHESDTTFESLLELVGVSSLEDYLIALRVNLKLNKIYLKRKPNEIMINNYSRKIISMFRSNMDIQYILDPYACCAYVLDYINKADRGMSKAMEDIYVNHRNNPNSSSFDMLKSLAASYYNASEISAQEAAYNLLGIRMVESSVVTIFIPTGRPETRTHILKSKDELDKLADDSTNCFVAGLLDHYVNRPEELEDITLAQFASYFDISLKDPTRKRKNNSSAVDEESQNTNTDNDENEEVTRTLEDDSREFGHVGKIFVLKNNSGFLRRRSKQKIIRYYKFNLDNDREEYFRVLIMLYYPWRNETEDLLDIDCESFFNSHIDSIVAMKKRFCKVDDQTLDGYMDQLHEEINDEHINSDEENEDPGNRNRSSGNYDRQNDFSRYTLDINDDSEGDYHRTTDLDEELSNRTTRNNEDNNATYFEKVSLPDRLSKGDYEILLSKLNIKQREYLMHIIDHVRYNRERDLIRMFTNQQASVKTFKPFYHFVTGGAGVGKSMLIKAIYESLCVEFDRNRDLDASTPTVLLTAPTGKAAFNIKGQTLHGAFVLPLSQFGKRQLNKLSDDVTHSMSVALKDLQVLIIDEISMVSTTTFSWIDMRLKYLFDPSLPFGGLSVIVLGDFNQLPPVASTPLYSTAIEKDPYVAVFGTQLWKMFKVHRLVEIMRQRDDIAFAVALNNMAVGKMSPEDIALIKSRVINLTEDELKLVEKRETVYPHLRLQADDTQLLEENRPICLFHSNKEVRNMNAGLLQRMETPGAISVGFDRVTGPNTGNVNAVNFVLSHVREDSTHQIDNLSLFKNLNLKINARYMIITNIDTTDGIVNGTTGYLKKIDFGTIESEGTRKPLRIWIKFDEDLSGAKLRKKQINARRNSGVTNDMWTMIEPYTSNIYNNRMHNLNVIRKQFPIVPAEALTTHKSQGGTYKNVVVYDTGPHRMMRSLIYVACSRATSAEGLALVCKNNKFVPPIPIETDKTKSDLHKEIERHEQVKLIPTFASLGDRSGFKIISHNIQSLQAHIGQIIKDPVYLSSDVILLNETWTLSRDIIEIPGFHLAAAVHCPSTTRKAIGCCCFVADSVSNSIMSTLNRLFVQQSNNSSVSVSAVKIEDSLYCSVYASPNVPVTLLLQAMNYILEQQYDKIVIAGDFNIDFGQESSKKAALIQKLTQYGLTSTLPNNITSTTKQCTFIDNIFTNQDFVNSGRYISLTSYHEPLWLQIRPNNLSRPYLY